MRAQVSLEFIILFSFALLFFILAVAYIPEGFRQANDSKTVARLALQELKLHSITASTADHTYAAEIEIPRSINGREVTLEVFADPDNLAIIKDAENDRVLAHIDLPKISLVDTNTGDDPIVRIEVTDTEMVITT